MPSNRFARAICAPLLVLALALLAGCGDDSSSSGDAASTGTTGGTTTTAGAAAAATSGFPATVTHKFGTTTVPEAPERVVSVGLTEHDTALALGVRPIATTEWYGRQPYAVWPWARAALGDARPTVLQNRDGFAFEQIAALQPDLILGTNSGMTRGDYEKLSALAPTIAPGEGSTDYFSPWDEQTELIATALGRADEGRRLVEDLKADYAAAAKAHPQFDGATISFNQNAFSDGAILSYPDGLNTEFLTYLGFEIEPRVTALRRRAGEQVAISAERLDVLDSDVALFATEQPRDVDALEQIPTFAGMKAVRGSRAVFTDGVLAGAMYFMTPLSLRYVLEQLPPQLARALDGKAPREIVEPPAG